MRKKQGDDDDVMDLDGDEAMDQVHSGQYSPQSSYKMSIPLPASRGASGLAHHRSKEVSRQPSTSNVDANGDGALGGMAAQAHDKARMLKKAQTAAIEEVRRDLVGPGTPSESAMTRAAHA